MAVAITYRTDDTGRWGSGVARNLSASELDINFWNVAQAIVDLQGHRPQPNNIVSVTATGNNLTIHLQDGTTIGPVPMPILAFRWMADWAPGLPYLQLDAFRVAGQGLFYVLEDHTSAATFDPNAVDTSTPPKPLYYMLFEAAAAGIAGLDDVLLTGLSDQQYLKWDATLGKWVNATLPGTAGLGSLSDVVLTTPSDGQNLVFHSATGKWINQTETLSTLSDVLLTGLADTQVLAWHAATSKWINVNAGTGGGGGGAGSLSALSDVALAAPAAGQALRFDGTNWANYSWGIAALADVVLTAIADGQYLHWSAATSKWVNATLAVAALTDVQISSLADGQVLAYHAATGKWINVAAGGGAGAANLVALSDVAVSAPAAGDILQYDGAHWANTHFVLSRLGDVAVSGPLDGQVLEYDAATGKWHNVSAGGISTTLAGDTDVALTSPADHDLLIYLAGPGKWENTALSALLDALFGTTEGAVIYRGPTSWAALAPGRSQFQALYTQGTGAPPVWGYVGGFSVHVNASFATAAALPSCTYSNGTNGIGATLTATANGALPNIDGVAVGSLLPSPVGYSFIVKDQTDHKQNGVYVITQYGDSTHPWILTRRADADQGGNDTFGTNIGGGHVWFVEGGTANGATMWVCHNDGVPPNVKVGVENYVFQLIAGAAAASGGSYLQVVSPASHDVLSYNATDAKFENGTLSALLDVVFGSTQYSILVRGASTWGIGPAGLRLASLSNNDFLVYNSTDGAFENQRQHYDIASFVPGVMTASQKLLMHRFSKAVTIPANFGAYLGRTSEAGGSVNATASTVINVNKAATASPTSFSNVGTITIAAGSVTPTFASSGGAAISFAQGDVLQLVGPATADTTLADFYATLCGFET